MLNAKFQFSFFRSFFHLLTLLLLVHVFCFGLPLQEAGGETARKLEPGKATVIEALSVRTAPKDQLSEWRQVVQKQIRNDDSAEIFLLGDYGGMTFMRGMWGERYPVAPILLFYSLSAEELAQGFFDRPLKELKGKMVFGARIFLASELDHHGFHFADKKAIDHETLQQAWDTSEFVSAEGGGLNISIAGGLESRVSFSVPSLQLQGNAEYLRETYNLEGFEDGVLAVKLQHELVRQGMGSFTIYLQIGFSYVAQGEQNAEFRSVLVPLKLDRPYRSTKDILNKMK